uniref:Uncharacterized protein n=1 Tax=Arundo donax TaxID=35708 RepID=A0A0A9BI18_ARUDO
MIATAARVGNYCYGHSRSVVRGHGCRDWRGAGLERGRMAAAAPAQVDSPN